MAAVTAQYHPLIGLTYVSCLILLKSACERTETDAPVSYAGSMERAEEERATERER